jgi:hypothetical protein
MALADHPFFTIAQMANSMQYGYRPRITWLCPRSLHNCGHACPNTGDTIMLYKLMINNAKLISVHAYHCVLKDTLKDKDFSGQNTIVFRVIMDSNLI